ncbi:redoxin domain-containing protein [Dyadobacter luticola]|uniref:Redoxin domain-containing protein n=1 Tax=Dyadobacter luticola TaxID=1979387 RepID=A0A5R9L6H1_9BACT|nr:redoxin domain-containing protein [Dyadobacter luticola]
MRMGLVTVWLTLLLSSVGALFWYNDWVYQLPTPIPAHYKLVSLGTKINLPEKFLSKNEKPVFLHFYNPECACSRFNKRHFQSLVKQYGKDVDFRVVVLTDKKYTVEYIQDKIGLEIPVSFDQSVANTVGVYSTPQAALIDQSQKLYYRGNYNASRYCTEEKSAYARIALAGLLKDQSLPMLSARAMKSYGCTIPVCKN